MRFCEESRVYEAQVARAKRLGYAVCRKEVTAMNTYVTGVTIR